MIQPYTLGTAVFDGENYRELVLSEKSTLTKAPIDIVWTDDIDKVKILSEETARYLCKILNGSMKQESHVILVELKLESEME